MGGTVCLLGDDYGKRISEVAHQPQAGTRPFVFTEQIKDRDAHRYRALTVDAAGRAAASPEVILSAIG